MKILAAWSPQLLSILRFITGFLFVVHGTQKLLGFPEPFPSPVAPWSLPYIAGVLELVGGGLMIAGLFTRPVAFVLSGFMAVAYFMAHAPQGFWPIINKGELAVLYCFVFLYFSAAGGGPWSIDALMRGRTNR